MRDEFHYFLDGLEIEALRIEQRGDYGQWLLIGLGIPPFVVFFALGEGGTAEHVVPALGIGAFIGALVALLGPLMTRTGWRSRREKLIWHMRQRVFGDGMLADYMQKRSPQGTQLSYENRELIEQFIGYFIGETGGDDAFSYRYPGGEIQDRELARAALMHTLARELRAGMQVFEDDGGQASDEPQVGL